MIVQAEIIMAVEEKRGMSPVGIPVPAASDSPRNAKAPAALLEQTRTRRLFYYPQLFSFSLVYLGTWYCTALSVHTSPYPPDDHD